MPDEDEKTVFAVPDTRGEPPLFVGIVYGATNENPDKGPGTPLYSTYIFPYARTDDEKKTAEKDGTELPLFVSYIFPFVEPGSTVLGGGGEGGRAALGGVGGPHIIFLEEIRSFIAAAPKADPPTPPPAGPVA